MAMMETRYTSRAIPDVLALQASMSERARPIFSESALEDLNIVIRLTVEFAYYLRDPALQKDPFEVQYVGDSIFSAIEFFQNFNQANRVMSEGLESDLTLGECSAERLGQEFTSRYSKFTAASDFAKQCRLLLDLFKIQIIYAGLL